MYDFRPNPRFRHYCFLLLGLAIVLTCPAASSGQNLPQTLVSVNIITQQPGPLQPFELNGRIIDYSPMIVRLFPSTGIVIDDKNHVVTFLGAWWVDIRKGNPRVEILDPDGKKRAGKIVGIDQSTRIAVILCEGKPLKKTALCEKCDMKDIATVVFPPQENRAVYHLESAPVVSVSTGLGAPQGEWTVQVSQPLTMVGGPLLDSRNQVIGIVTDQEILAVPSKVLVTITPLTATQMINSANIIIKTKGDIQTGWLGVWIDMNYKSGVMILGTEPGSPAHKAGILPGDIMVKWNGDAISDFNKYIAIVENTRLGSKARIEVLRRGRPVIVEAIIEARRRPQP